MIHQLRHALASADFRQRLADLAAAAPATAPVSITVDLGSGGHDWLSFQPHDPFWYWAQPNRGDFRLGLGHALQVASAGPNRFAALEQAYAGFARHWRYDTLPVAFLGFAFGEEMGKELPNTLLAVPALLLRCRGGRCSAVFTGVAGNLAAAAGQWSALLRGISALAQPVACRRLPQPLADRAWLARVGAALEAIGEGRLDKLVLTRGIRLEAEQTPSATAILSNLVRSQPDSTIYAHGSGQAVFLGATPERLVTLRRGQVEADALAGTAWPGSACLNGDKNSREQALVADAVRAALAPLCRELVEPARPQAIQAGHLTHLHTCVGGPAAPGVGLFDLIRALHPTPAVGGSPTPAALDWLRRHGEQRVGWYSGGIGHIDAGGEGEIAVALRCALLCGRGIELHAGAGIVAGSNPAQELAETEAKLTTLLEALQGPAWEKKTGTR